MFPSLYGVVSQGAAAASWWVVAGKTCVAAYQPIGAASLAASYTNLANPGTYDAAPVVAPTWASADGWKLKNQSVGGGHLILADLANGYTVFWRFTQYVAVNDTAFYATNWGIYQRNGATDIRYIYKGTSSYVPPFTSAAVVGMAGGQPYRNGVVDGGAISGASNVSGALHLGKDSFPPTVWTQAIAIYSDTLSGAEVATLSAAMAALT